MIAPSTLPLPAPSVVRTAADFSHLADTLRDDAALELRAALDGATCKRMERAAFPGLGLHGISRALNGSPSNPLYRIAVLFLVMKRMGLGREGAERIIGWLQEIVDLVWPPEEVPSLEEVLDKEQDLDAEDDPHQQRIGRDPEAAARMLEVKRRQLAHDRVVVLALRRAVAG